RLGIDNQLELARLYDRQVRRLRALENATGICADLTKRIRQAASVAHQPAGYDIVTHRICRGDCVARRQVDQLDPSADEKRVGANEECVGPLAHQTCEGRIDLPAGAGIEDLDFQSYRASASTPLSVVSGAGQAGLTSTATRVAAGTSSRRSSSRFAVNSIVRRLIPVRFPSGRARLATRPSLTGSAPVKKTMGIVVVAALAADA